MWLSSQEFDFPTIGSSFFFFLFLNEQKRVGGEGRPTWQSYMGVTIAALYPLGPGPARCKGTTMSHSFPNP